MFNKILIANRGEIALRIQRACRELGIRTVAVYSQADSEAKYVKMADEAVCIGPPDVRESYLNAASIIAAAEVTDSEAIHPGYGLLSENADFAEQIAKSGFKFIGPSPAILRKMGDKMEAKKTMKEHKVDCVDGADNVLPEDQEQIRKFAANTGYPLVVKAVAGGGGRGMREVNTDVALLNAVGTMSAEALRAFGDGRLYIEKLLTKTRHIEVQILADTKKNVIHLGTRDCSVQRRYQKVIEEAPATGINSRSLDRICEKCVDVAKALGYVGAGTFEFLFHNGKFYFIEMNPRIQVEHPVTEVVTGVDVVIEQLRALSGDRLSVRQKDIAVSGHSIQCRINSEDPETMLPSPGRITSYHAAGGPGVRVDSHVYNGYLVPPYYDSLLGKLIVYGKNREQALARMRSALTEFVVDGVNTNIPLHRKIFEDHEFLSGSVDTNYLERHFGLPRPGPGAR